MKRWVSKAGVAAALAVMLGAVPSPQAQAQETRQIRFASVGGITDAPLYIAEEFGYFKEAGLSVDRQRMTSAPNLMTAVATNQLDAAGISITPGLFASVQQGMNLRLVGDKQSLRPGVSATRLVIRSDLAKGGEAENMAALKGRKIAVSAKASSVYMFLEDILKKHGMSLSDVQVVELSYPNMLPALTSGAIDGAINLEPFLSQAVQGGVAEVVSDLSEFAPAEGGTIVPIVYSEEFAQDKEAAQAFMKAYMRGVRVYNDAMVKDKDREKIIEIIARYAKVKPEVVRDGFPAGMDPNQNISIDFLDRMQNFFVEQNLLRQPIEVTKIVDSSFVDAAIQELGRYE